MEDISKVLERLKPELIKLLNCNSPEAIKEGRNYLLAEELAENFESFLTTELERREVEARIDELSKLIECSINSAGYEGDYIEERIIELKAIKGVIKDD